MYIFKCNHNLLGTIANTVVNNGQAVLPLGKPGHKTNPSLFQPLSFFTSCLPDLYLVLTSGSAGCAWRPYCFYSLCEIGPAGPSENLCPSCSTLALPLASRPHLSQRVCCGEAEFGRKIRNRCLVVNWPHRSQPPAWLRQGGGGHSRLLNSLWIIHECTPSPLTVAGKFQIKFFSSPEKDPINVPGSGRFTI